MSWSDVAIAVPTMPQRATMLAELTRRLAAECPGAAIVVHRHTSSRADLPETIDLALAIGRPWVLLVEDDAWPCPGFGQLAGDALAELPTDVAALSFFSRLRRDVDRYLTGERWRWQPPSSFVGMLAVAVRTPALAGFSAWAPSWYSDNQQHVHAADLLLGAWLSGGNHRMRVYLPSLVEHRAGTLPGRYGARQSSTYRLAFSSADV